MKEEQFIKKNISKWEKLEQYNKILKNKSISSLSKEDISEFTELYQIIGHQLAYSKTHFENSKTTVYLNNVISVAHNFFYIREKSSFTDIINYYKRDFPQKVRENYKFFWISFAFFMIGMVTIFVFSIINNEYIYYFFPKSQTELMDFRSSAREVDYPTMGAFIMTNNIRVCLLSFVWGFFGGIGTLYVLIYNGAILGVLTSFVVTTGSNQINYWALILPHGVIELTAIFISGAAGLIVGKSILIPNNMTRKHSLIKGTKEASVLIPGVATMLIIAGIIEGFFTPLDAISSIFKLVFSLLTFFGIIVYFVFMGKGLKNIYN